MMENYSLSTDFIQEHSKSCISVCTCKLSQISVNIFYIIFTMKTNTWFCNTSGFNMRKNVKKIAWEVCKSASSGVRRGRGGEQRPPWSSLGRRAPAPGGGWAAGRGRQVGGGQDPGRHRGGCRGVQHAFCGF